MVHDTTVIGSGMIGTAFAEARFPKYCVIYAAGPSNSSCTRQSEFDRDRERLSEALQKHGMFIYISTCSVEDKPYTHHKRAMEELVKARGGYLILRLPIVAGRTTNPHTLLNFLADKVKRGEEFDLYMRARRNVIDVQDVVAVADWLVKDSALNETVNVAAPQDYSVDEIVRVFERLYGRHAHCIQVQAGDAPRIDVTRIADAPVDFSGDYLERTLRRYYK